jgi:Flp pilus assembly protein TadB
MWHSGYSVVHELFGRRGDTMGGMRRARVEEPMLITSARSSYDDEYARRRKKYAIMMSLRALCVLAAGLTYQLSILLALAFVVGGAVLPWCAVLIANDRPAKKRAPKPTYRADLQRERALPPGVPDDRTVDG